MKKGGYILVLILSIMIIFSGFAIAEHDYSTALEYSVIFFDANRCGPEAGEDNYFDWRDACHTQDGEDVGVDLTGGFHDAGDHMKFGLPQAYAASMLGWAFYRYEEVFKNTGIEDKYLSTLRYFGEYFLKCHADTNTFYYQVGCPHDDHSYWGPPEEQDEDRPTELVATESDTASDVLAHTAAVQVLMYFNFKDIDSDFAEEALESAKELYDMATNNLGRYELEDFYESSSYHDDLAWGAIWLYQAEGDEEYLADAIEFINDGSNQYGDDPFEHEWTLCWDDMYLPAMLKLYQITGDDIYSDALEYNLDYWMNSLTTTPGGLGYLDVWGVTRYASAASMLALMYYEESGNEELVDFALSQINYILGDNPEDLSYLLGYGEEWPQHPHHRAANGYSYAGGEHEQPAQHLLLGALIGGPDQDGNYIDDVNQFHYTEVAIDYNASFVGAAAAIIDYLDDYGTGEEIITGDVNGDGEVNIFDAIMMAQYIVGEIDTFPVQDDMEAADLNGDGSIDIFDIILLAQYIVGETEL